MDINIDAIKAVALEAGKAGAPFIEQALSSAIVGATGPFGLLVSPVLNMIFPMINTALGLDANTPPDQTAAAIAADPDAAKDKLAGLAEDHQFQLATQKQAQDFTLSSQAQQVALNTVEVENPSLFIGGWRPALAWALSALLVLSFVLPYLAWLLLCAGFNVPPPPPLSTEAMAFLSGILGITVAARSVDKATGTAAPKIGGTSTVVAGRRGKT